MIPLTDSEVLILSAVVVLTLLGIASYIQLLHRTSKLHKQLAAVLKIARESESALGEVVAAQDKQHLPYTAIKDELEAARNETQDLMQICQSQRGMLQSAIELMGNRIDKVELACEDLNKKPPVKSRVQNK